jgi:predicted nuclease of restriction endonuclease-like (RecB) superfamily
MSNNRIISKDYSEFLEDIKVRVMTVQRQAVRHVNTELMLLYYHIGTEIIKAQRVKGWGAKIIDQLSRDLKSGFPNMKGFSAQNLKYMRRLAEEYERIEIGQQLVDQLPWGHIVTLLYQVADKRDRFFYIENVIEHGWSRSHLIIQIENRLHMRQGKAITNFAHKLPVSQSEKANNLLKDPYLFDFLSLSEEAHEREVEKALIQHMEKFLLELGAGFAFMGRQYNIAVGGQDFFLDLLFYHVKLRCFVVIELKDKEFKPEYAGKMNFYLSAVDDLLKHPDDQPSIGLILCKTKNNVLAEYTLRDMNKPIGLAEYRLTEALPEEIKSNLPSIEELEAELAKNISDEKDAYEEGHYATS